MGFVPQKYRKSLAYSYTYGVFPTLELCSTRPDCVEQVFFSSPDKGGKGVAKILRFCRARRIPISKSATTVRRLSGRDFPVVGVLRKYSSTIGRDVPHVVLHQPQYEGNVGTVIRTMLGFGFRHLALICPGPDLMSPEVIRASMGAVFRLHWERFSNWDEYRQTFPERLLYCFMPDGDAFLEQVAPRGTFSPVFGSEGGGLPKAARRWGATVRICHDRNIDSLNLGVAIGIVLRHISRTTGDHMQNGVVFPASGIT